MSSTTLMQIMNKSALRAILTEFGHRLGAELGESCPDTFQAALDSCLLELPVRKAKISTPRGPSKASLKLANRLAELIELGGDEPEEGYGLKELNDAIRSLKKLQQADVKAEAKALKTAARQKAAEDKKAAKLEKKAASPKSNTFDRRFPSNAECDDFKGANGSFLRVTIHRETRKVTKKNLENWTDEAIERFTVQYPDDTDPVTPAKPKKIKKTVVEKITAADALDKEQQALIVAMTSEAVTDKLTSKKIKKKIKKKIVEPEPEPEPELEELEEELEELDDEPEFPGEESVQEFEHSCLDAEGVDYYVDENSNIWDHSSQFVGKYDDTEDCIDIVPGYAPIEEDRE